jgi:formylglycine-generating enzyme required for sulfatase activity
MDLLATRELARIQSVLHVLKAQHDILPELSDISALRDLEESFREDLQEAQKRGLVPKDPVAVVREDWYRLSAWSNRIQLALRKADDLVRQTESLDSRPDQRFGEKRKWVDAGCPPPISKPTQLRTALEDAPKALIHLAMRAAAGLTTQTNSLGPKPDKESAKKEKRLDAKYAPTLLELQRLKTALESAAKTLADAMEQGLNELQPIDWSNGQPYSELAEIADAMEWPGNLELAESPGPWAHGIRLRDRFLISSRLALENGSSAIERRQKSLADRLSSIAILVRLRGQHEEILEEVVRLTDAGQVDSARQMMATIQVFFGDLDYSAKEQKLLEKEKQLDNRGKRVSNLIARLQGIGAEASGFFFVPPLGLKSRSEAAVNRAENLLAEIYAESSRLPIGCELECKLSGWAARLKREVEAFKAGPINLIRRWILKSSLTWLVVLATGLLVFQLNLVKKERERQRMAAAAKAAEEKASAEAKAKAEIEERELQLLVAESQAKAEASETAIASKLGLSKPFVPGARGQAGGLAVRWIPGGWFRMGSSPSQEGRFSGEEQHEVVLPWGFFIAETECTQSQWEMVMEWNPSEFKGAERPVERVTWKEAMEYCRKLTTKQQADGILPTGWEWRLPTEAEWEYAARAGTTGPRHGDLDAIGWWEGNSGSETHPVKQKAANGWGLHDTLGNVWEWCLDWSGDYPTGRVTDPRGPSSGKYRVGRGGCWYSLAEFACSANRSGITPDDRGRGLGFRPVLGSVR